jgi:hypothetical protein
MAVEDKPHMMSFLSSTDFFHHALIAKGLGYLFIKLYCNYTPTKDFNKEPKS